MINGDTYEVSKVLKNAKATLQRVGWVKGVFVRPDGRLCSLGAIKTVLYGDAYGNIVLGTSHTERVASVQVLTEQDYLYDRAADAICKETLHDNVADWNDSEETTYENVMDTFDAAIARCGG